MPIDATKMSRIRENLFHCSHSAISDWQGFPWHTGRREIDTDVPHSSQALAIDVFGTIKTSPDQDIICDRIAQRLGVPIGGPWNVKIEYVLCKSLLHEPRPTQIDILLRGRHSIIVVECKFTETAGGHCSQPVPLGEGTHRGAKQCCGHYEVQTNSVNNVTARCALTGKGIGYWDYIPKIFGYDDNMDHSPCPFAGPQFQWMRNIVAAHVLSLKENQKPAFMVIYADSPSLCMAQYIKSDKWNDLTKSVTANGLPSEAVSYQEIVALAAKVTGQSHPWEDLAAWVNMKIEKALCNKP